MYMIVVLSVENFQNVPSSCYSLMEGQFFFPVTQEAYDAAFI